MTFTFLYKKTGMAHLFKETKNFSEFKFHYHKKQVFYLTIKKILLKFFSYKVQ
jgi:hypothetical protein